MSEKIPSFGKSRFNDNKAQFRKNLDFTPNYVKGIKYKDFIVDGSSYGDLIGRTIIALPAAIGCATVKPIYHLICAIFSGMFCQGKRAKAHLFHIACDFQMAGGWLITFFVDKPGQYLVQRAWFCKAAYDEHFKSGSIDIEMQDVTNFNHTDD